jgi:hypothetical protein
MLSPAKSLAVLFCLLATFGQSSAQFNKLFQMIADFRDSEPLVRRQPMMTHGNVLPSMNSHQFSAPPINSMQSNNDNGQPSTGKFHRLKLDDALKPPYWATRSALWSHASEARSFSAESDAFVDSKAFTAAAAEYLKGHEVRLIIDLLH